MARWKQVQFKRPVMVNGVNFKPTDTSVIRESTALAHANQGDLVILGNAQEPLSPEALEKAEGDVKAGVVEINDTE